MAKLRKAKPGEINFPMFDQWAIIHAASGLVFGAMGTSFMGALAISVSYEVVENSLKRSAPRAFPVPTDDTEANHVGDVVSFMLGWALSRQLK